mmetsp:Transcript_14184/g.10233  ORF Transcript_14184/g.10233 Transcript_14184/m.10233 type:complete len:138 (-) Transcript_14184:1824-2237(-)
MPLNITYFLNYALKLYPENYIQVQTLLLSLVISSPALNSLTRICFDASLRKKFICKKKREETNADIIDTLLVNEQAEKDKAAELHRDTLRPIYERLTQTETLNNLVATFSGICMLMDEVYDIYFTNTATSEIIDSLA